jgi:RNA recognition motif-containing protein
LTSCSRSRTKMDRLRNTGFRLSSGDSSVQDGYTLPIMARVCRDIDISAKESSSIPSDTNNDIWVGNLPSISEKVKSDLQGIFRRFGTIRNIAVQHVMRKSCFQPHFFAFITFAEEDSVDLAVNAEPIAFYGEHVLKIEKRRSPVLLSSSNHHNGTGITKIYNF